ncbi:MULTISPECIES: peroxiredoxin family protein [Niastella]|uniref:TlpA family protein disulfide reductase n=1 Tax=Niastella soli TaxID=2821487 RepID=A0ABS3YNU6_9BACT|nr:TlpA disulfide reductase family protein [Niastella soli]MBO9199547.1 TlpA family protein disulfide reductase [Niastella soli]
MFKTKGHMLIGCLLLFTLSGLAQTNTVIKGTVLHPVNDFIIVSVDGFMENRKDSVLVSDSGYFKQEINLKTGNYVTITYANQDLRFPVSPGDSVDLTLDESLLTYNLTASNPIRKREITAVIDNTALFEGRIEEINAAAEKRSDSLLNTIYNQQLKDYLHRIQQPSLSTKESIHEIYYRHLTYWLSFNPVCALKPNEKIIGKELYAKFASLIPADQEYLTPNESLFYASDYYRTFLLNFKNTAVKSDSTNQNYQAQYQAIIGDAQKPVIKDWLIMNYIKNIYRGGSYADALRLSDDYKPLCQNAAIKERIKNMDLDFARLKNGNPAPGFTLEDLNGNNVSLSDFKGKWVYLNFWSTTSGVSINDFMKYGPIIKEKYKDKNIVFLNICFEEDATKWKKRVEELQIDGTNVIARGWPNLKICKDYQADPLPRTFLIDKDGNINNNHLLPMALAQFDASLINEWLQ